ncbi:MAG: hypothetical protein MI784_00700 [Cytophagales bacterium]|nr:hypothetical protein [Cytophagales bacterium]
MKKYTRNDIIRYLYGETSIEENLEIEITLALDERLERFHWEMSEMVFLLNQISEKSAFTRTILDYSKNYPITEMNS